jgi:hypothetical protein
MARSDQFRTLMSELVKLCQKQRNNRYLVHQGIIVWQDYDFSQPALSIQVDEQSFLRPDAINYTIVSLEFGERMEPGSVPGLNRDLQTNQLNDAAEIFESLEQINIDGDDLIFRIDRTTDKAYPWSDAEKKVQGLVASVYVEY